MDETARFTAMMLRSAELKRRIATELAVPVLAVVDACETSYRGGGKLMFCGNGGSAADSQHLATEMLIRLRGAVERESYAALALTLDPAALTACGNDYGYDRVFERPLRGLGRRGDVLFGITTFRPLAQRGARARGGAGNGHRHRRPARRRGDARTGRVRPCADGAGQRNGAHPGMPHRPGPCGAGTARRPAGDAPQVTVLLTGAAGFIGCHVAQALLARARW